MLAVHVYKLLCHTCSTCFYTNICYATPVISIFSISLFTTAAIPGTTLTILLLLMVVARTAVKDYVNIMTSIVAALKKENISTPSVLPAVSFTGLGSLSQSHYAQSW